MKTAVVILLFSNLCFFNLLEGKCQQVDVRQWHEGPLKWNDFRSTEIGPERYSFNYNFNMRPEKWRMSDTIFIRPKAVVEMNRALSYVRREEVIDLDLSYAQMMFDIMEIQRRNFQKVVYTARNQRQLSERFNLILSRSGLMLKEIELSTNGWTDRSIYPKWKAHVDSLLNSSAADTIPSYVPRAFGMGLHFSMGSVILDGTIAKHYSSPIVWNYGFDFSYKKIALLLEASLGGTRVKKEHVEGGIWERRSSGFALGDVSIGYYILDKSKWKITPSLGFGFMEFTQDPIEPDGPSSRISSPTFLGGALVEYKFRKQLKLVPSPWFGIGEYTEFVIRTRFVYGRATFTDDLSGQYFGIIMGLGFHARSLRTPK